MPMYVGRNHREDDQALKDQPHLLVPALCQLKSKWTAAITRTTIQISQSPMYSVSRSIRKAYGGGTAAIDLDQRHDRHLQKSLNLHAATFRLATFATVARLQPVMS